MAKALWQDEIGGRRPATRSVDWQKRMSDHIAAGLLLYTGLHIFVTMQALNSHSGSILPYFGLVFLVAAVIPGCRLLEKRWEGLVAGSSSESELQRLFYRDAAMLWTAAISLPFLVTGLVKGLLALT